MDSPNPDPDPTSRSAQDNREKAKQWLTKGALVREDSDDELGYDDYPWEWVYEDEANGKENTNAELQADQDDQDSQTPRRRSTRPASKKRRIVAARMGTFECRLGHVVLLKSPEAGKDWVGIITEFVEEDDDDEDEIIKSANIMWFASPEEFLSTKNKKRADALPNEQYLTVDFNINPLTSINGRGKVMSKDAFFATYPNGVPPKGRAALTEYHKCIVCRRGVNQLQGKYTEEFLWEDVYKEDEESVFKLVELIKTGLKAAKKRKAADDDVSIVEFRVLPTRS
jgi:origin recognition complex subunit 1